MQLKFTVDRSSVSLFKPMYLLPGRVCIQLVGVFPFTHREVYTNEIKTITYLTLMCALSLFIYL